MSWAGNTETLLPSSLVMDSRGEIEMGSLLLLLMRTAFMTDCRARMLPKAICLLGLEISSLISTPSPVTITGMVKSPLISKCRVSLYLSACLGLKVSATSWDSPGDRQSVEALTSR